MSLEPSFSTGDLHPAQVRLYAERKGWRRLDGETGGVIVLNDPNDDVRQLLIPVTGTERDRRILLTEAVRRLAEAEGRTAQEVLADLQTPSADTLRVSIESPAADTGTLGLDDGLRLIQAGRNLLLAAACSAHQPQPYHARQSFAPAQEFLRACRLGQTERGSFVAAFIAPVAPELTQQTLFDGVDAEPYARQVTLLLMQAVQAIRLALDRGHHESLVQSVSQGVSGNLCEALAMLPGEPDRARVRIHMAWSLNRPHVPAGLANHVVFHGPELPVIAAAGQRLRGAAERRRERLEGPILSLRAEPARLFEAFRGTVVIRTLVQGQPARVRFVLNQTDYARACDAHRDSRPVAISGIVQREVQSRLFEVIQPTQFEVQTPG